MYKKNFYKTEYYCLKTQDYLLSEALNKKELKLLVLLRSYCHSSKMNFRKMNIQNLKCILKCGNIKETQFHVFDQCTEIPKYLRKSDDVKISNIYSHDVKIQVKAIKEYIKIENYRKTKEKNILPGGVNTSDPSVIM